MPSLLPLVPLLPLAVAVLTVSQAHACPPGHYSIGGGTGGWVGCAPMDGGVGSGQSAPSLQDLEIRAPGLSTYDPKAWADFITHLAQQTIEQERQQVPPHLREVYESLLKGTWMFGQSRPDSRVPMCMASFHTRRGGVMFLDWGGPEPATTFSFFGDRIPRVNKVSRVRVRLEQSGTMQEVEAFHTGFPLLPRMGMVMMRVPSTQALLSAIDDVQDYKLSMDERQLWRSTTIIGRLREGNAPTGRYHEVSNNTWHSGHSARDSLAKCLKEQGR